MKLVKVYEIKGAALDWAVAKAQGLNMDRAVAFSDRPGVYGVVANVMLNYSTDWSQGGPIIERENMTLARGNDIIFPNGNETGDTSEPLYLAKYSDAVHWIHGGRHSRPQ